MLLQCENKTTVANQNQDCCASQIESKKSFTSTSELSLTESKNYEFDLISRSNECQKIYSNQAADLNKPELSCSEYPEHFAHRLLIEFGKTRTNYNSLVPRIVEVIRLYRDYGPLHCPLPVVSNLEALLNDEALSRIEQRYPNSLDAGFVVLCTERRALRSGGGGKYYFIDVSGRLVGCHKSDLANYAEKKVLNGPVLLKNLIFVFIMRNAYGLDPRCKSSNPQRLLEYYENLAKEGKSMDIQRLVRVWSMEIFPESPFDAGYPHCSLLWVKRMHLGAHINKWKRSHWNSAHLRAQDMYPQQAQFLSNNYNQYYHNTNDSLQFFTGTYQQSTTKNTKRRKTNRNSESFIPQYDWGSLSSTEKNLYNDGQQSGNFMSDQQWDSYQVYQLYIGFNQYSSQLQKSDVCGWSINCVERLSTQILAAAIQLMVTTFNLVINETYDEQDHSALKKLILKIIVSFEEKEKYIEALRILLACLVQQQRLETVMPKREVNSNDYYLTENQSVMTPLAKSASFPKNSDWKLEAETISTTDTSGLKTITDNSGSYQSNIALQFQTPASPLHSESNSNEFDQLKTEFSSETPKQRTHNITDNIINKYHLNPEMAWQYQDSSSTYNDKKRRFSCQDDAYYSTPIYYSKDFYSFVGQSTEDDDLTDITNNSCTMKSKSLSTKDSAEYFPNQDNP